MVSILTLALPSSTYPTFRLFRDKSSIPKNAATIPYLDLYTEGFGSSPLFVARLARNIDVYSGSVTVKVPEVRAGSSYLVMRKHSPILINIAGRRRLTFLLICLVGSYGHTSDHFSIKA